MVYENRGSLCLAGWPVTERLADTILPEADRKQQTFGRNGPSPPGTPRAFLMALAGVGGSLLGPGTGVVWCGDMS